jgi:YbbR domain-containing protein
LVRRWINDLGMLVLSIVLAVVVWIVAVQQKNPIQQAEYAADIPVEVRNQPDNTTFLPATFDEQVRIIIRAPRSSWDSLRADKFTAWIDLKGRDPGDYDVPVQATCIDPNVRIIEVRPATVTVRLKEKMSRTVPVQIQLYGTAALGYRINADEAVIDPETVTVTGPATIVGQVTKATVDLYLREGIKETFTGSRTVVARQANGDAVGNNFVSIDPPSVQITVPIVLQTDFKEVVVRPRLTGSVAAGYWVRGVTVDPLTVLLGGDPAVVAKVGGFVETMPLDITDATSDVVERVALDLPEGASPVGVQGVKVTVNVAPQEGSLIITRRPVVRGLSTELTATVSPEEVEVTLIGPLARLNALADADVYVYVDLLDKGVGQYRVELTYLVPEGLQVGSILPAAVDVEITQATPVPTPTPTRMPTPTPTPTLTVTGTAPITGTVSVTGTVTPTLVPGRSTPAATPKTE